MKKYQTRLRGPKILTNDVFLWHLGQKRAQNSLCSYTLLVYLNILPLFARNLAMGIPQCHAHAPHRRRSNRHAPAMILFYLDACQPHTRHELHTHGAARRFRHIYSKCTHARTIACCGGVSKKTRLKKPYCRPKGVTLQYNTLHTTYT